MNSVADGKKLLLLTKYGSRYLMTLDTITAHRC
jgi:hypothetical protein